MTNIDHADEPKIEDFVRDLFNPLIDEPDEGDNPATFAHNLFTGRI
jgi:hypothetical protein